MVEQVSVVWNKTKKNVLNTITKYIYYSLSVDNNSTSKINEDYSLQELVVEENNLYSNISEEEKQKRVNFINYVRRSFNKLTCDERKIIYWTYFDKENGYDDRFIADSLGFSLGYYYIKKKETLIRFAYSLGIEVMEKK